MFGFTQVGRCLLADPQSLATIAPTLFMNISLDSTWWNPNLVHFYSGAVYVPLYQCIMAQIHH